MSLRGDVIMNHHIMPILHFYDSLPDRFSVPVLSLEEIMAEKIRAAAYTKHPRHLYDILYLYRRGVKINPEVVRIKIKSVYGEDFDLDRFKEGLTGKAKNWTVGLRHLLSAPPPSFDDVSKKVLEIVTDAMK